MQAFCDDRRVDLYLTSDSMWEQLPGLAPVDSVGVTSGIVQVIRHAIGATPTGLQEEYGNFALYDLDITPLVENLRISRVLPVVFLRGRRLVDADVEALARLLDSQGSWQARFLLILAGDLAGGANQPILANLAKRYGCDAVFLSREDLSEIAFGTDPRTTLRRRLLSEVNLAEVSPFSTVGPTPNSMFFGREREIQTIKEGILSRSFAIIGGRRIGKSSLLIHLHQQVLLDVGVCTLYKDCSPFSSYDSLLGSPIPELHSHLAPSGVATLGVLLDSFPTDRPMALLLDEADSLVAADRDSDWHLFKRLRVVADMGYAQIILAGERLLRAAARDSSCPLFGLTTMRLGPLDLPTVSQLIVRPMAALDIEIADEVAIVSEIYDITLGHPNMVQRLCQRLVERADTTGARLVTLDQLHSVLQDPYVQTDDLLHIYWESATALEKIVSLLMAEDEDIRTPSDVQQAIFRRCGWHPKPEEISEALDTLVELRSILRITPEGYSFASPGFPRIVRRVVTVPDMLAILVEESQQGL